MRTDSTRLSPLFVKETYNYIKDKYGSEYVGKLRVSKTNNLKMLMRQLDQLQYIEHQKALSLI